MGRKELAYILILIFLSLFLFTFKLGEPSLFETDEYIYTKLAKEIVETGDWLTLHLDGREWFIHPPLYMWLTALAGSLFGFSEFIARIWCALFGVGLVLVTYLLGKKLFNQRAGFLAGLILATSFQYIIQSRLAIFDIPLIFFITLAVFFFFSAYTSQQKNLYYLFYLSMGFGVLTKGPIAAVLPIFIILVYIVLRKEFNVFKEAKILSGLLVTLIVGGSWYFAELLLHGREFWDTAIGYYTLGRYFGVVETHAGPVWFYIPIIFFGFLPWTAFVPASLAFLFKDRKRKESFFLFVWVTFVFVFFSLGRTKLPGYIMSVYPFLALSLAATFDHYMSFRDENFIRRWMQASFFLLLIIAFALIFFSWYISWNPLVAQYQKLAAGLIPILIAIGVGGVASSSLYLSLRRIDVPIAMLSLSMAIFLIFFTTSTVPAIEEYKPMRPLARKIASLATSKDLIVGYKTLYKMSYEFYLEQKIKWIENERDLLRLTRSKTKLYCLIGEKAYERLKAELSPYTIIIDKKADIYLLSTK